ncbi:uncharacterized protein EV420DRAFT_1258549 [Desarmillaria tabescens]|uniref:F-box domain-containing protein n=1 Tax=Armillaria tabescens TaxID=1929756 RepID=A0AA39NR21_ARMTA|nr:uncharacterized protein EV420DRAFT_1258549 [Desarmillaria tabescens]KAK0470226.1 hypothetical protein EV420DRAFT_1258549 [Desarmillaria tabescens]
MNDTLYNLPDDVLIYIIAFLSVTDILLLRQTCKRFNALTKLHIVWTNAFKLDILSNDYPVPIDDTDLEQRTRHAYRLASRWLADSPLMPASETGFTGSTVSEIKFIPGRQHKWLLTVSKGIWSVLTIWDITRGHKCSEWSPRGALFTGVKLNTDTESEASIAVALDGSQRTALLQLDDDGTLHKIHMFDIDLRPVTLTGDIIALSDDFSKTLIYNWKTDERAYLDEGGDMQVTYDHCIQIIFTALNILVIRARSINLYTTPPFLHGQTHSPIASYSFGWVDGASATPASILIRSESDNPWASELNSFELYSLSSFPPTLTSKISSRRGALRCTDVILGKRGTAVWIRPHDRAMVSHWEEHDGCETLMAAVFPGPLNSSGQVRVREVCSNPLNNWTALDYDEELGRIALGSGFGKIKIVQL